MRRNTYLDYNASAPAHPEVAEAVADALSRVGNPSSVHGFGRAARRTVEHAREAVAALVGANPAQVVFTSGGTEANNQALAGANGSVIVSSVEHDSVLAVVPDARRIAVDGAGIVRMDDVRLALDEGPALLSVMLANNETGVIQPVAEVAALAHAAGALVHCDVVQAAGKMPIDMVALGIDFLTLSAHKLAGPQGVGALVAAEGVEIAPFIRGGGQERRRRSGTENTPGIAGFGVAARIAVDHLAAKSDRLAQLQRRLEQGVVEIAPNHVIHGATAPRLPNTSCIGLAGIKSEVQVMALDLAGVAVGAGAACSSGKVTPSHVLTAMGLDSTAAASAIRVSLGWGSTADDVDHFLSAYRHMLEGVAAAA